jgi:hypothetical protein
MVLTPNDLFSWNNKYSKYTIILSHIHTLQRIHSSSSSYARHLLCACWHSEVVKGSSSLSSRRLLISLWLTSPLFLCPELTDAPCPHYGGSVSPSPKWRPHSQGPHTLPFQGTRQLHRPQEICCRSSPGTCNTLFNWYVCTVEYTVYKYVSVLCTNPSQILCLLF